MENNKPFCEHKESKAFQCPKSSKKILGKRLRKNDEEDLDCDTHICHNEGMKSELEIAKKIHKKTNKKYLDLEKAFKQGQLQTKKEWLEFLEEITDDLGYIDILSKAINKKDDLKQASEVEE
jgi:hypothetical protein